MTERSVPLAQLAAAAGKIASAPEGFAVSGLAYDSRRVTPGSLFVAVVGESFDGHRFVRGAVGDGAAAVAIERGREDEFADLQVPRLVVESTRRALAPLACAFYGNPTHSLYLAGVTGTNGKTTTARMIDAIARAAGDRTGVIGTLGATIDGRDLPGDRTTPEAPDLQALFAEMVAHGVQSAAMEVASHAIAMGRTEGCAFDVGVFTNLTQDHLDYHKTMEAYRDTKLRLFEEYALAAQAVGKNFTAVLNVGDTVGVFYKKMTAANRTITYASGHPVADITITGLELAIDRITFQAMTPIGTIPVTLPFGGAFNVQNALAAIGYGIARELSAAVIADGLAQCPPVPGRFQPVRAGQEFAVLVDYAHTPDGLENVLRSARPLTQGRLITVFGCGGNRDRTKRPRMGRLAVDLADVAIVTSDNPRREDPEAIIDEVLAGMDGGNAEVLRQSDRRAAIRAAVRMARPGDTVVIAGKGHETYQIVGDATHPFDDVAVATGEIRDAA